MKKLFEFLAGGIFLFSGIASAEEPTLTIATKAEKRTFTVSELLKRKDTETVVVENDPVYPDQKMEYVARLFSSPSSPLYPRVKRFFIGPFAIVAAALEP
jgi:hypothetical protein